MLQSYVLVNNTAPEVSEKEQPEFFANLQEAMLDYLLRNNLISAEQRQRCWKPSEKGSAL